MNSDLTSRLKSLKLQLNREPEVTVKNCQFLFECKAKWTDLIKSEDKNIRFCDQCQKDVHLCLTDESLIKAISFNYCVAIYRDNANSETVGVPIVRKK